MDNSQSSFDPREFGLSADDLDAVADRLYDAGDKRLEPMTGISARFGKIRSHIRALADAMRNDDTDTS